MKRAVLLVLLGTLLISGCGNSGPTLRVYGTVTDFETRQPIAGAWVGDDGFGPGRGSTTDSMGEYHYFTWYEEHDISASATGYEPMRGLLKTRLVGRELLREMNFLLTRQRSDGR